MKGYLPTNFDPKILIFLSYYRKTSRPAHFTGPINIHVHMYLVQLFQVFLAIMSSSGGALS